METILIEGSCSYALAFKFLLMPPIGDTTKRRNTKNGNIWGFLPSECDRI